MALTTVPVELANLDGAVTVNESSADADFRVESNGSANMLFVDGGNDEVVVQRASSGATATAGSVFIVEDDDNAEMSILGGSSSVLALNFGHSGDADDAIISYNTTGGSEAMGFSVAGGTNALTLSSSAAVFNEGSADIDFRVESNDSANMLYVDGGNNKVLIEAQNTDTVSNSATLIAAGVLEINGNAGEGSDHIKMGAMADGTGNQFIEATNSSGASSYKLMINPVNGGNLYSGGNLEFPSGKGIDFSATGDGSGTDSSELLDDYEEGTYTVTGYDASSGGNASSTTITGYYTKIGRQVTVTFYAWNNIDTSGMTAGNQIFFSLPFVASAYRSVGSVAHHGWTYNADTNMQDIKPITSASKARAYFKTVGYGQADNTVKVSDITSGADDIHTLTITYFV